LAGKIFLASWLLQIIGVLVLKQLAPPLFAIAEIIALGGELYAIYLWITKR
jgi:hypothetical protein